MYESDDSKKYAGLREKYQGKVNFKEVPNCPKRPLGDLRNLAVELCRGPYFCQWDGDDWYAANRLTVQMNALRTHYKPASMLSHWIIFDAEKKAAYLSPFRFWEGSIVCEKAVITADCSYASAPRGEDTALLEKLLKTGSVIPVFHPALYIYVYHGENTWNRAHFSRFFHTGKKLSAGAAALIGDILDGRCSVADGTAHLQGKAFLSELEIRVRMVNPYDFRLI